MASNLSANGDYNNNGFNGFNGFNSNANQNYALGIGLRKASSTQPVLMRHLWSTNTNATSTNVNKVPTHESSPIGLGLDLHATGTSASGSPVVETRSMERDDDATSQDSVTPTQSVPNAPKVSSEEEEDAYRFNPRESFVSLFSSLTL